MATKVLSTTAEELLPRGASRKSWSIQNEDASIAVYIKRERVQTPTVSSTDHDWVVPAGAVFALNSFMDGLEAIRDRWTIVAASGTPRISFFETEDQVR